MPSVEDMDSFPCEDVRKSPFFNVETNGFDLYTWRHKSPYFPVDFVMVPLKNYNNQTKKQQTEVCTHDRIFMRINKKTGVLHLFSPFPKAIDNFLAQKFQ